MHLPNRLQSEIFARLNSEGYRPTLAALRQRGISTSLGALADFYKWYQGEEVFIDVQGLAGAIERDVPGLTPNQVAAIQASMVRWLATASRMLMLAAPGCGAT